MKEWSGIPYMLLATALFALMNVGVKLVGHLPTSQLVVVRAFVTLLLTYPLILKKGISPWGNNRRLLFLRGATGTVGLIAYFYTLQKMPLATAVALKELAPIFTVGIAALVLGEKATFAKWVCFLIGFIGTLFCRGVDGLISWDQIAIGSLGSFFAASAYICVRKLRHSDDPLVTVFFFPLVTLPVVGSYSLFYWVHPNLFEWGVLVGIGIVVTLAQYCLTMAYHLSPASSVSHLNYLGAIYGVTIGWFFFGETLDLMTTGGIFLILSGALLARSR